MAEKVNVVWYISRKRLEKWFKPFKKVQSGWEHSEIGRSLNIVCCRVPVSQDQGCLGTGQGWAGLGRAPGITINLMKTCAGPSLPLHTCHARYYMYSGTGHSVLEISVSVVIIAHFYPFQVLVSFLIFFWFCLIQLLWLLLILSDPITLVPWSS